MSTFFVRRVGNVLHGADEESTCELMLLPFVKPLKAEIKLPRNPAHHRLFFSLCHRIAGGIGSNAESVATVFKYATGHYDIIKTTRYGDVKVPKSISFAQLDQSGFKIFFDKCIVVAFEEWGLEPEAFSDLLDPKTEIHA